MQRREPAHRNADDMGLIDRERVEHGADIVARPVLRIAVGVIRHIGGRIAAGIVRDAAVTPAEIPHLPLVAAIVVGEFVDEHDRGAGAGLLVIEADPVIGRQVWHRDSLLARADSPSYGRRPAPGNRAAAAAARVIWSGAAQAEGLSPSNNHSFSIYCPSFRHPAKAGIQEGGAAAVGPGPPLSRGRR